MLLICVNLDCWVDGGVLDCSKLIFITKKYINECGNNLSQKKLKINALVLLMIRKHIHNECFS